MSMARIEESKSENLIPESNVPKKNKNDVINEL
jgi:hypothetical protein